MCLDVENENELIEKGERKARKEHECRGCRRTIRPGERYRYWTEKDEYDDKPHTSKMCAHCWATIDVCADFTHCPRAWYWDTIYEMDADDGGFLGDILVNHELTRRQRAFVRLCAHRGRKTPRWTANDGTLYPVPSRFVDPARALDTPPAKEAPDVAVDN